MIEQTKSQMYDLKLIGMLQTLERRLSEAQSHGWGHIEFLSSLVTDEKLNRDTQGTKRRIKAAQFRTTATLERIDYGPKRGLPKSLVRDLMTLTFLKTAQNIFIEGPTGAGKTFLATALGEYACRMGFSCHFVGFHVLIQRLLMARADGTYLKYRDRLIKTDCLIIDDIGLEKVPPDTAVDLNDLLEERQSKTTLITTQLPLRNWKEIIDDPLLLETLVDKLANQTIHIELSIDGDSMRKKVKQENKIDLGCVPLEITNQ